MVVLGLGGLDWIGLEFWMCGGLGEGKKKKGLMSVERSRSKEME